MNRKRFRKWPLIIILAFLLFAFWAFLQNDPAAEDKVTSFVQQEHPLVKMVKGGTNSRFPDVTYGDAFEDFFGNPTWTCFTADTGEEVVEFTGDCTYQEIGVKARLQFIVHKAEESFEPGALSFNEVPQNMLITASLLEKVFTSYYEEHASVAPMEASGQAAENSQHTAPPQNTSKKANPKPLIAEEWLGKTTGELFASLGTDYKLEYDLGAGILYYDIQGNQFGFSYEFNNNITSNPEGNERIFMIYLDGTGEVSPQYRCGMTDEEIQAATDATTLLGRGFSDVEGGGVALDLVTETYKYSFIWDSNDVKKPCTDVFVSFSNPDQN